MKLITFDLVKQEELSSILSICLFFCVFVSFCFSYLFCNPLSSFISGLEHFMLTCKWFGCILQAYVFHYFCLAVAVFSSLP